MLLIYMTFLRLEIRVLKKANLYFPDNGSPVQKKFVKWVKKTSWFLVVDIIQSRGFQTFDDKKPKI